MSLSKFDHYLRLKLLEKAQSPNYSFDRFIKKAEDAAKEIDQDIEKADKDADELDKKKKDTLDKKAADNDKLKSTGSVGAPSQEKVKKPDDQGEDSDNAPKLDKEPNWKMPNDEEPTAKKPLQDRLKGLRRSF